jgi:hypothetical protein
VFPKRRIAKCPDAERRDAIEIRLHPAIVPAACQLIDEVLTDSVQGALEAAPELDAGRHAPTHSARGIPAILAKSVKACATTWSML